MCNIDSIKWVAKNVRREEIFGKRIIEVGSYDVNGSARFVIEHLEPAEYIGIDIASGPGVDVVCPIEKAADKFGSGKFDVVISTCVLEHTKNWKEAVSNIKNICTPCGIIIIVVPFRWPYHEYPGDFWRYSPEDIKNIFSDFEIIKNEEDIGRKTLTYAKMRKPILFKENDLSHYRLYSVVTGTRTENLYDKDFKTLRFKFINWKYKFKKIVIKVGTRFLI